MQNYKCVGDSTGATCTQYSHRPSLVTYPNGLVLPICPAHRDAAGGE